MFKSGERVDNVAIHSIAEDLNPILATLQILQMKLKEAHKENGLLSKRIHQKKLQLRRTRSLLKDVLYEKDKRISAMAEQIRSLKVEVRATKT